MSDDLTKRGKQDRIRISIKQTFERLYWCKAFGITQTTLREAVKQSGPMVRDVKLYLINRIKEAS